MLTNAGLPLKSVMLPTINASTAVAGGSTRVTATDRDESGEAKR
jgi:hypothetical protein